MKIQSTRGFPRSPSDAICEHVRMADNSRRRPLRNRALAERISAEPPAFDLCTAFGLSSLRKHGERESAPAPLRSLPVSVSATYDTREFFIPYNPPRYHTKKDGTTREMKIKVQLITATVFLQSGTAAPVKIYTASNRGQTILDCRTQKRLPLCEVQRELARLGAQSIGEELAGLLS